MSIQLGQHNREVCSRGRRPKVIALILGEYVPVFFWRDRTELGPPVDEEGGGDRGGLGRVWDGRVWKGEVVVASNGIVQEECGKVRVLFFNGLQAAVEEET